MFTLMVFPLLITTGAGGNVGWAVYGRHWVARPTAVISWTPLWAATAAVKRASPSVAEDGIFFFTFTFVDEVQRTDGRELVTQKNTLF